MKYCLIDVDKLLYFKHKKNNVIYRKDSNGLEYCFEYDDNGNEIHYKDSSGYESWREFDLNGKEISYKNSLGLKLLFDKNGNIIYNNII